MVYLIFFLRRQPPRFSGKAGLGSLGLASLPNCCCPRTGRRLTSGQASSPLHHKPKVKRVIQFRAWRRESFETLDYKPKLREMDKLMPKSITEGQPMPSCRASETI